MSNKRNLRGVEIQWRKGCQVNSRLRFHQLQLARGRKGVPDRIDPGPAKPFELSRGRIERVRNDPQPKPGPLQRQQGFGYAHKEVDLALSDSKDPTPSLALMRRHRTAALQHGIEECFAADPPRMCVPFQGPEFWMIVGRGAEVVLSKKRGEGCRISSATIN